MKALKNLVWTKKIGLQENEKCKNAKQDQKKTAALNEKHLIPHKLINF